MQGMSEREYAAHAGLSRGAIQKAKVSGRLVLHTDGSIDAAASDARRAAATDPSKSRTAPKKPEACCRTLSTIFGPSRPMASFRRLW